LPADPPGGPLELPNSGFPCELEAVLKAKCRRCHTEPARFGAPFSLLAWDVTRTLLHGAPIYEKMGHSVKIGFMPYQAPANPPIARLTEAEKLVIVSWADAGGPRGDCGAR
jgi:hypothetical protein